MIKLTDLDVYSLSETLSDIIWNEYDRWDKKAQNTIGYQIIRSSDSISANIAEGYGRFITPDRKKFYIYARGSFEETKCWLRKAIRRGIVEKDTVEKLTKIIDELVPKLNSFIKSTT